MNAYSSLWFKTFLETIPDSQTEKEAAFVERCLPRAKYTRILDLCCGEGRHARLLAARGYSVIGLDRDVSVIEIARDTTKSAYAIGV